MADMDTMGARLKHARERAGFDTAAAFAKVAKVNPTTYRAYENDQNSFGRLAPELAALLKVPTDWLLRGGPLPDDDLPYPVRSEVAGTGVADVAAAKWGEGRLPSIPLVGSAMGGEWDGVDQHVEMTELDLAEVLDYVRRPASLAGDGKAYAVTTVGDSMFPRFRPGRRLIVSPREVPSIGDDVVVQLLGAPDDNGDRRVVRVLIKELVRRSATQVTLRQYNPQIDFTIETGKIAAIHKVAGELF